MSAQLSELLDAMRDHTDLSMTEAFVLACRDIGLTGEPES